MNSENNFDYDNGKVWKLKNDRSARSSSNYMVVSGSSKYNHGMRNNVDEESGENEVRILYD